MVRNSERYRKQVKQLKRQCEEAERRCQQLQDRPLQRQGLDNHSEDDITKPLINIVNRRLEQDRGHRLQRGSDLSSIAPLTPPPASRRDVIIVEEGQSDANQMDSRSSRTRPLDASSTGIDVAVQEDHSRSASSVDLNIRTVVLPPPKTELDQPQAGKWVPMPGWGEPWPQERPRAPRASQEDLPLGIVHYDDGTQLREEYRRPRRSRHQVRSQEHNHHHSSSGGSALSGGSSGGESDSNIGSGSGASVMGEER